MPQVFFSLKWVITPYCDKPKALCLCVLIFLHRHQTLSTVNLNLPFKINSHAPSLFLLEVENVTCMHTSMSFLLMSVIIDISLIKSCKNTSQITLVVKIAEVDCCFTGMSLSGSCFTRFAQLRVIYWKLLKWDITCTHSDYAQIIMRTK